MKRWHLLLFPVLVISYLLDPAIARLMREVRMPLLDTFFGWFSHEISVFFVLVVISAVFLYEERKKKYIPVLFLSFILATLASILLKQVVGRWRPTGIQYTTIGIMGNVLRFVDYSFPSTHAAAAFAVLPVLDKEFCKIQVFWIIFAALVALSRIYLNQHYLSDVVGGMMLGYITGYWILRYEEKHEISKRIHKHI